MAVTKQTSIVIDRPIEQVWAFIDNPSHDPNWRPLKSLKRTGSEVGARYEGVVPIGPRDYPYVNELTEYQPPRRMAWKAISSAGWMIGSRGSYTPESEHGRTRWTIELTLDSNKPIGRVLEPLVRLLPPSVVFGAIPKKLKEEVEQQA